MKILSFGLALLISVSSAFASESNLNIVTNLKITKLADNKGKYFAEFLLQDSTGNLHEIDDCSHQHGQVLRIKAPKLTNKKYGSIDIRFKDSNECYELVKILNSYKISEQVPVILKINLSKKELISVELSEKVL